MDSFDVLNLIKPSFRALPSEAAGSHSKVFFIDPGELGEAIAAACAPRDRARARALGTAIGNRFLVKIGNIHDYVVKFTSDGESYIPRQFLCEAFGPGGYNLAPTPDKVRVDVQEAARQIPYMGFGSRQKQLAPDILGDIGRCVGGQGQRDSADGTFLVQETALGTRRLSILEILDEDPFFKSRLKSFEELRRFQRYLRAHPIDSASEKELGDFFNAPMTVGLRDVLRFLEGSRHPALGWDRARGIIIDAFDANGGETFLPPEFNYYASSLEYPPEYIAEVTASNDAAAFMFAAMMREAMPPAMFVGLDDDAMKDIAAAVLAVHFDYPEFEIDPHTGVISTATARLAGRLAAWTVAHIAGISFPDRRNPITVVTARKVTRLHEFLEGLDRFERESFMSVANRLLWKVAMLGGVPDPQMNPHPYRRINRTFFNFQELAQYPLKRVGTLEETVTLEDMHGPAGREILRRHPELASKLLVFFVLAHRYHAETGYIPDLRPDDVGGDLFLRGIYGYSTRNVMIALGRNAAGEPASTVRFIDNRDQFKQYRRWEDKDHPLGFVKYGLRLLSPVARPGLQRAIGIYAERTAGVDRSGTPATAAEISDRFREALLRGVGAATNSTRVMLEDAIDDTSKGIEKLIRRFTDRD